MKGGRPFSPNANLLGIINRATEPLFILDKAMSIPSVSNFFPNSMVIGIPLSHDEYNLVPSIKFTLNFNVT